MSATRQETLRQGITRLQSAGVENARSEAEWLLARLLEVKPLELHLDDSPLPLEAAQQFLAQITARASGIPLQYLLGDAEFFGLRLAVAPGVFIPRPETEVIVQAVVEALRERSGELQRPLRLLDLGTGSGCIAISLARALPACVVVGVELSWRPLCAARENIARYGLTERVHLIQSRWMEALRGTFDGMVTNPPYVPSQQVDRLPLDVRQEPRLSLDGGRDGLREVRVLLEQVPEHLSPGGIVAIECGEDQADYLASQLRPSPWVGSVRVLADLAHRPRGVLIIRNE